MINGVFNCKMKIAALKSLGLNAEVRVWGTVAVLNFALESARGHRLWEEFPTPGDTQGG